MIDIIELSKNCKDSEREAFIRVAKLIQLDAWKQGMTDAATVCKSVEHEEQVRTKKENGLYYQVGCNNCNMAILTKRDNTTSLP